MENSRKNTLLNGIWKENPLFVGLLGTCPSLGITTSLENALGMGIAVLFVLVMSNLIISLIKKIVPNEIRIAVYIVVIATLVTIVDMVMAAFLPELHESLGLFIPLIVVNCIILGRAEAYASKNSVVDSMMDAIGISGGFLIAMLCVSLIREIIGTGCLSMNDLSGNQLFSLRIIPEDYIIPLFNQPTGAFLVLGVCVASYNAIMSTVENKKAAKAKAAKNA